MMPPRRQSVFLSRRADRLLFEFAAVFVPALLFVTYFRSVLQLDPDAMSIVAMTRADLHFHGWPMGFALLTMMTRPLNALVNLSGLAWNDFLLAYRLVVYLSTSGTGVCTYAAIVLMTRNRPAALLFSLMVLSLPGLTKLSIMAEDNLFSSFTQMLYLVVFLAYAKAHRRGARRQRILYLLLPAALVFSILSHREMNVLWATPAALVFLSREPLPARLRRIAGIYALAAALFLLAYAGLTILWDGRWTVEGYAKYVLDWFYPTDYYQDFYFWKRYGGWKWHFQFGEILKGIKGLLADERKLGRPVALIYSGLVALLIAPLALRWRLPLRRLWLAPLLFGLLHLPHTMIFESENLERWDAIAAPLAVFAGALFVHLHRSLRPRPGSAWVSPQLVALAIILIILYGNFTFRRDALERMREASSRPAAVALTRLFQTNVAPERAQSARRRILLLTADEYFSNIMLPSTYFSWKEDIFIVEGSGKITQPGALFPTSAPFREPDREQFLANIEGAEIAATPRGHAWVRRLRREANP